MDVTLSAADMLALASVNIASLLGLDVHEYEMATKAGSLLEFESKVVIAMPILLIAGMMSNRH